MENRTAIRLVAAIGFLFVLTVGLTQFGVLNSGSFFWWLLAAPVGLFVLYLAGLLSFGAGATLFGFLSRRR